MKNMKKKNLKPILFLKYFTVEIEGKQINWIDIIITSNDK